MHLMDTDIRTMASGEQFWPIPMKAIGAQNLLTMPGGVTVSGYLHKKGGTQLTILKWPLRFVIIHKGCIYYFKSSTSASPQGAFSLNGYNRVMRAAEETTSNNVFPFKIAHISKKHRTWYFSAACEEERKKWMMSLRKEIDYYHEKKDPSGTLSSDSSSDSDSFYGSIERPVNIMYSPEATEAADYDEEEEEYLLPDPQEAVTRGFQGKASTLPPAYPPPPVPPSRRSNSPEVLRARSFSSQSSGSLHAPPPPKRSLPELRLQEVLSPKKELPPVPKKVEFSMVARDSASNLQLDGPPPLPPPAHLKKSILNSELQNRNPQSPKPKPVPLPRDLCGELGKKLELKSVSSGLPPIPANKPKVLMVPVPSGEVKPLMENKKPALYKPEMLPKPPPAHMKPNLPSSKPTFEKPPVTLQRSSPDGQSFRTSVSEKPSLQVQSRLKSKEEDLDDDDYENVCYFFWGGNVGAASGLERLFKTSNSKGNPQNGLYCIRNSSTKTGQVLVVWDESLNKVRNYRIFEKDLKVYLETDMLFSNLATLVEHYYSNELPNHETLRLQKPYGYTGPS
nr:PREDICTED: SH3 domain-binding protein 2 [Latimeria chalumnae]|eukprot:XP_014345244.1 PREDICTED: SH3 domain-binding protein 2 [Latimeria chalumnae]